MAMTDSARLDTEDRAPDHGKLARMALQTCLFLTAVAGMTLAPYVLLGLWNRLFGGWRSVFFCYAGSPNFISTYAPPWMVDPLRWRPSPLGVLSQSGTRGLVLAAPVTEAEFLDPANAEKFATLQRRLWRIARILGVQDVNMAGILPSVLKDEDIRPRDSRAVVAAAVDAAARKVAQENFKTPPPIILIGGAGHVGAPTADRLREWAEVHVIDPKLGSEVIPQLEGPALVIDIARRGVLTGYLDQLRPGWTVLNETFPQPSRTLVSQLRARGIDVWHLSGLKGRITPPLPFGYADAVPCCAAHEAGDPVEVRVVRLS
ncbi:MAG: hypothetical protein AAF401_02220 [Pseudomonadota bacterium]